MTGENACGQRQAENWRARDGHGEAGSDRYPDGNEQSGIARVRRPANRMTIGTGVWTNTETVGRMTDRAVTARSRRLVGRMMSTAVGSRCCEMEGNEDYGMGEGNTHRKRWKNRCKYLAVLLSVLFCLFGGGYLLYRAGAADAITGQSVETDSSADRDNRPGPVAEYLRASELVERSDVKAVMDAEIPTNAWTGLSVPTYLTKVDHTYFLVDCYHNQVIYNDNLQDPLSDWKVMTTDLDKGHTLASDGTVYLIDDTERNRVLVFEKREERFVHTQTFDNIGNRPHYIIYDAPTDTFYVWSSMSGEMYLFRHNAGDTRIYLTEIRRIESLDQVYVRSFTIIGSDIYFVSGNAAIIRADLESFEVLETYPVPDSMAGMIQLTRIQDFFYITISTDITGSQEYATMIRTRELSSLTEGDYEDVYGNFIGGGTPYYITELDDAYYLTEHRLPGHSVWRFRVEDNEIVDVETVY